jgi:hypothetical protein
MWRSSLCKAPGQSAPARSFGLQLHVLQASTEGDFDTVFANLVKLRVGGLVIGSGIFFVSRIEQLAVFSLVASRWIPDRMGW